MPIMQCQSDGKPGFKYGNKGHCYTYTPNNKQSKNNAKKKAIRQGLAESGPDKFKQEMSKSYAEVKEDLVDMIGVHSLCNKEEKDTIRSIIYEAENGPEGNKS